MVTFDEFNLRMEQLRLEVAQLCRTSGRNPGSVEILPVTKTHPPEAAFFAARCGLRAVGENRVQEAVDKRAAAPAATVQWELIGHLQSNKAKIAAATFDRIQSVDSEKLLNLLDRAAGELGKQLPVLLQINAGNDPAKFGADLSDADKLLDVALAKPHLRVDGLMTIAPLSDDPAIAERTFVTLRQLRDDLSARTKAPLATLSMGMSGDYAAAIAAGSTLIRIGTRLYGERPPAA